jgi:hypothetical protein
MMAITNPEKRLTVADVEAELAAEIAGHRLRKRKLNALLAVLKAEAAGQQTLPSSEAPKKKA